MKTHLLYETGKAETLGFRIHLEDGETATMCGRQSTDGTGGNFKSTTEIEKVDCYFCKKALRKE